MVQIPPRVWRLEASAFTDFGMSFIDVQCRYPYVSASPVDRMGMGTPGFGTTSIRFLFPNFFRMN